MTDIKFSIICIFIFYSIQDIFFFFSCADTLNASSAPAFLTFSQSCAYQVSLSPIGVCTLETSSPPSSGCSKSAAFQAGSKMPNQRSARSLKKERCSLNWNELQHKPGISENSQLGLPSQQSTERKTFLGNDLSQCLR